MLSNALATSRLRLPDEKIAGSTLLPGPGPEVCRKLEGSWPDGARYRTAGTKKEVFRTFFGGNLFILKTP